MFKAEKHDIDQWTDVILHFKNDEWGILIIIYTIILFISLVVVVVLYYHYIIIIIDNQYKKMCLSKKIVGNQKMCLRQKNMILISGQM